MSVLASDTLKVPGASLYYEVGGAGPVLLFIAGGSTDAGIFGPVAAMLADAYTVVTYDPRGNSRSPLDGPAEDQRIDVHANDARLLLEKLSGGPARVFGSSSGAIVGLDLVVRYPELIRVVVAHEPPAVELLVDPTAERAFFAEVYERFQREGVEAAMQFFGTGTGMPDPPPPGVELPPPVAEMLDRFGRNNGFFLEHELRQFTSYVLDIPALHAVADRIVLAGGADSGDYLPARPGAALADRFDTDVTLLPGGHVGYMTNPVEFAAALREVLAAR